MSKQDRPWFFAATAVSTVLCTTIAILLAFVLPPQQLQTNDVVMYQPSVLPCLVSPMIALTAIGAIAIQHGRGIFVALDVVVGSVLSFILVIGLYVLG